MEEESKTKANKRRRIIPVYHDDFPYYQAEMPSNFQNEGRDVQVTKTSSEHVNLLHAMRESEMQTTVTPDLKTLLKQSGEFSLSEILQQKNLSLTDLLNGELHALSALTERRPSADVITEYKNPMELAPDSNKFSNKITSEEISVHQMPESEQTERVIDDVSTQRIYVPANSKHYTTIDYKPNIIIDLHYSENERNNEKITGSTTETIKVDKQRNVSLPITSAKLNKKAALNSKKNEKANVVPPKAYKIDIGDLYMFAKDGENETIKKEDGPYRISLNLHDVVPSNTSNVTKTTTESVTEAAITTSTSKQIPEKLEAITAKDEIMEILKDESAKQYLSKVLEKRNMTIQELVELRERGTSQRHLADIFHNKTKEPEPVNEPHTGHITNEVKFRPQAYVQRKPKHHPITVDVQKDSNGDQYTATVNVDVVDVIGGSKVVEEHKDGQKYTVTSFPTFKIEMDKKFTENQAPVWKISNTYSDLYTPVYQRGEVKNLDLKNDISDIHTLEVVDNDNTISEAIEEKLEVRDHDGYKENEIEDVFIKLPYGVKSAIYASLSVIGGSLIIFLTILVIFKLKQKHKQRLCYTGSFSCSKTNVPILQNVEKRTFRILMNETLGRKKHYYKNQLQSMSDTIWENDKKPFQ